PGQRRTNPKPHEPPRHARLRSAPLARLDAGAAEILLGRRLDAHPPSPPAVNFGLPPASADRSASPPAVNFGSLPASADRSASPSRLPPAVGCSRKESRMRSTTVPIDPAPSVITRSPLRAICATA